MFQYLAILFAYKTLSWIPTPLAYVIADFLGTVMYYARGSVRRNVQRNMRQVMGPDADPKQVRAAARSVLRNSTRYYADLIHGPRLDINRFFNKRVKLFFDVEYIREAMAARRGVIITSGHYGNPEIVAQSAVAVGIKAFSLTEPLQPQRFNDFVHKLRSVHGQVFSPLSFSTMKEAIRILQEGERVVPILCDRAIGNSGKMLPFFGAETLMPVGPAQLALRTNALVIPMFCRRVGNNFEVYAEPPMEMIRTGDEEEDVRVNSLRIIACIEKFVKDDPGQWIVLESLWDKSR